MGWGVMTTHEPIAGYTTVKAAPISSARMQDMSSAFLFELPTGVQPIEQIGGHYSGKRAMDAAIAATALIVLAPLLGLIWLLVYVTSGGPGLFWSERVGRNGRTFWMPKFRTMVEDAPLSPREVLDGAESHITPIGAWLRRSALDELPQLYCILKGDMSIIGPRPLLPSDPGVEARRRFPDAMSARPGLSGLSQVVGRNSVTPRRKARFDAFYARSASFGLDVIIFWRTVEIVLTSRGFL
jgi:O-antigen biosynthesis protein WbqP